MRFTHQPGAQPLEGYTIHRGIHRGGFGEVYYARSDGGKEVALKLLQREQDVELRGVRQCLNLKHPNLVNLFDVRTDAHGEQWVVMEYINGSSLEDVLASFPNGLPLDEVQDWLSGIVAGVTHLHDRGIVHRDLKPANVYRENGTVKVGDVGLSKRLGTDRRAAHTQSVGTVYYMAPEVGRGEYGPEVDVYSLGIMLYEMLTGQLPFMGETTAEVLMKHLTATAGLNGIPAAIRPVVARALAKDPRQRTPSAMELEQEFRDALNGQSHGSTLPVSTGFANGATVGRSRQQMAETPSHGIGGGVSTDTATSIPVIVAATVRTKSTAQSASAFAQYPPESVPPATAEQPASSAERPTSTTGSSFRSATSRVHFSSSSVSLTAPAGMNWPLIVMALVGLLLFSPGTWRSWMGLGLIGVACGVTSLLRGRHGSRISLSRMTADPQLNAQISRALLGPRPAIADTAASLAVGSVGAALLSLGFLFTGEFFRATTLTLTPELLTLFVTTALAATWLILMAESLRQHSTWLARNPRKTFLMVGVLIGLLAYGLDQYLLVDFSRPANYSPAFHRIGVQGLMDDGTNPTLLGYLVFFGGMLFWHRWWADASPERSRQLSVGRLCTTGIAAWLLTVVFAFPQWPGIFWMLAISASVQLASPWSPRVRRSTGRGA